MKEIVRSFLDGSKEENEFYGLPDDGLCSLRNLLEANKIMDSKFRYLAEEEIQIAKRQLRWLESVSYGGLQNNSGEYIMSTIYLNSKDSIDLIVSYNKATQRYEDISFNRIPTLYRLSSRTRIRVKRQEEILDYYIQDLLKEIESAGKYVYNGCLSPKKSVGGEFTVYYSPSVGMIVSTDDEKIASYYHSKPKSKEKTYLDTKSSDKLLDRIKIKKDDLPKIDRRVAEPRSIFPDKATQDWVYETLNRINKEKILRNEGKEEKND